MSINEYTGDEDYRSLAFAEVEYTSEENEDGRDQDCVYARCLESGDGVGPIWGGGINSVRRALAELTENCSCGASFHEEI